MINVLFLKWLILIDRNRSASSSSVASSAVCKCGSKEKKYIKHRRHICSYRCVFFVFCLFFVSPCLVLSVASWGSVSLAVSSSSWEWRFLYSYERYFGDSFSIVILHPWNILKFTILKPKYFTIGGTACHVSCV